mmetsp:Transcript_23491/g.42374  ORF Transcript_23491/g.42374 Transcript_23491/m.42374 type:complete len:214 (+) Transcript_23491:207-848(+)
MRKFMAQLVAGSISLRHLRSMVPLPFAFLKEDPPRLSETDVGRRTILNSTGTPSESSNGGETFSRSEVFRTLASTVQRTLKTLLATLKTRCSTGALVSAGLATAGIEGNSAGALSGAGDFGPSSAPSGAGAASEGGGGIPAGQRAKRSTGTAMDSFMLPEYGAMPIMSCPPAGMTTIPTACEDTMGAAIMFAPYPPLEGAAGVWPVYVGIAGI